MTPSQIHAARRQLGMTLRQFSRALGVTEQTARRWEMDTHYSGHRAPGADVLRNIRTMLESLK